jgi:hypothetical protein
MNFEVSIECEVMKGMFSSEYFVKIKKLDGSLWEGTVDKEMVFELRGEVNEDTPIKGRIYAFQINTDYKSALIELPVENSTMGSRINVGMGSIRKERMPA